jgi:iron complex transport system substrate-binding protein
MPTDTIIGVPTGLDEALYPEFIDKTSIGMSWELDVEAILALYPDLVLLAAVPGPFGWSNDPECELMEAAGVTVIRNTLNQPATIPEEMETLGYIFEKEDEAEEYNEWHEGILNLIVGATSELEDTDRPKVYCEWAEYQVSQCDDDIIKMAGGKDIFAGIDGEADKETLIEEDPDIIIRTVAGMTEIGGYGLDADDTAVLEDARDEIMGRPELQNVTAVKNGNVYVITSHLWSYLPYSGNKALIGICYMEKWFEPFTGLDLGIDPKMVHQEFIDFQDVDIDLDEYGVFVYPEE